MNSITAWVQEDMPARRGGSFSVRPVHVRIDDLGEPPWLVERHEHIAVLDDHHPRPREGGGQRLALAHRHDSVLGCPDDRDGAAETPELARRRDQPAPTLSGAADVAPSISKDRRVAPRATQPLLDEIIWHSVLGHPPECEGSPPERRQPHGAQRE